MSTTAPGSYKTYNVKSLSSPLAEPRPSNDRNPLRGRDVATGGVLEKVVGDRHLGWGLWQL